MVRYLYGWTPLLIVGTLFILSLPWLGLIALMIAALVVLPTLALAILMVPYLLGRAISRIWRQRSSAIRPTAPALRVAGAQAAGAWRGIDCPTPQLVPSTDSNSPAQGATF